MDEAQQLKDVGLKVTGPRMKVLQVMKSSPVHHLSAEGVYKALLDLGEDVGLATVYRVLTQFEAAGIVTRHYFEGGHSVFECREGMHHDHLVCIECSRVDEFVDALIENQQQKVARTAGFRMTNHALTIYGICKQCQVNP